ncbi:MAG: adenylate/guanylate cyclase domain-containing protein [Microcoleaceae cyanobacterium MO_207.B10]|nr:adenylate/guanylate cyclase domain-containing protein [Microcoleaceae cyanobacterium MO_207.B10]
MAIKTLKPINSFRWLGKKINHEQTRVVVILVITILSLLFVRSLGKLQALELAVFDCLMRLSPDRGPDPRILIVEVTEEDIHYLQQWPISDRVLANVLASLQEHQPQVIGIDIYRDIPHPPGYSELVKQLDKPNVIAINFVGHSSMSNISSPPTIPIERIGFNNINIDPDGVVRRHLMFTIEGETTLTSFPLQLVLVYLQRYGIFPDLTKDNKYRLGNTLFQELESNSGGYQTINSLGYHILINYRTPESIATKITIRDVLNSNFDPKLVTNKIVLIGTTAPSARDIFFTPYSFAQLNLRKIPGVEVHAQVTSQIITAVLDNQKLFWYWSESTEIIWIFAWSIVGAIIGWNIRQPLVLGLVNLFALSVLTGIGYGIFISMGWVPIATPGLGIIITSGVVVVYKMQLFWQQENMVMKLLGQQTSPEIAQALWDERSKLINCGVLPPRNVKATILFTDLKNFSSIAEKKSSEDLMIWLNKYLSKMTDIVLNNQGIVNKFTGDGVMAVFGIPVPRTSVEEIALDAENAVNCALEMGEYLSRLNHKRQQQSSPQLKMRIGIYTGIVTVGSLGGKNRLEYGVIGDSVNIASRLESFEKNRHPGICRILIAGETLEYLDGKFQLESWGDLILKGKQIPVSVYLVTGRNFG